MAEAPRATFTSDELLPPGLAKSPWSTELLPARVELLTRELDPSRLSELGAIGFAQEIRHAARIGAAAAVSQETPQLDDVIVIGRLFRTGTTLLHDLLASALPRRVIRGWEALDPTRAGDPSVRAAAVGSPSTTWRCSTPPPLMSVR